MIPLDSSASPLSKGEALLPLIKSLADKLRHPLEFKKGNELSLSRGYPGILLLLTELDHLFPAEQWGEATHAYVLKMKAALESGEYASQLSLFGGLAGVGFSLHQASSGNGRYTKFLASINQYLLENVSEQYFAPLRNNLNKSMPSSPLLYDLIQGIVGIGIYGLTQVSTSLFLLFVKEILHLLIRLTVPIQIDKGIVQGWYIPHEKGSKSGLYGTYNLGLAHGVPGILGFLSIAALRGVIVEGQLEAIEKISKWTKNYRQHDSGLFFWDQIIPFEDTCEHSFSGRDAWCYGTPGVARTLFLAGKALKDEELKSFALESFRSVFKRTVEQWHLPGPTLCHGIAGLLLITWVMARDTQAIDLNYQVIQLKERLLGFYSDENRFGFRNYEQTPDGTYTKTDRADLLEGLSGILLTLLALEQPTSWWHAPFLVNDDK